MYFSLFHYKANSCTYPLNKSKGREPISLVKEHDKYCYRVEKKKDGLADVRLVFKVLQDRLVGWGGGWLNNIKGPPLFSRGSSPILDSLCLPPEERRLSKPEIGEKERKYYLFEIMQTKVL